MERGSPRCTQPADPPDRKCLLWHSFWTLLFWPFPSHHYQRPRVHRQQRATVVRYPLRCSLRSHSLRRFCLRPPQSPWHHHAVHSAHRYHRICRHRESLIFSLPLQDEVRNDIPDGDGSVLQRPPCPCLDFEQQCWPLQTSDRNSAAACDCELWWLCVCVCLSDETGASVSQGTYNHLELALLRLVCVSNIPPWCTLFYL